jgi:hypothetical protein
MRDRKAKGQDVNHKNLYLDPLPFRLPVPSENGLSRILSVAYVWARKRSHGDELASNQLITEVLRSSLENEAKRSHDN